MGHQGTATAPATAMRASVCPACSSILPSEAAFCSECGTATSQSAAHNSSRARADKGVRAAGYLIDVLPAVLLGLFGLIPLAGPIIAGLLLTPYWLLRDVVGASIGKLMLGERIESLDGSPAGVGARILRNLPLAVGPAFLILPIIGYFLGPLVSGVVVLVETILLLSSGERLGDRIAKTVVVRT